MLEVPFLWLSLRLDDILATNRSPVGTIALPPGRSSSLPLVTPYVIVVFRSIASRRAQILHYLAAGDSERNLPIGRVIYADEGKPVPTA